VRYTYSLAGFEQDIILREQPPDPAAYGLNAETTRLQVLTEFVEAPSVRKAGQPADGPTGNETLDFGAMRIGRGKAFALGESSSTQRKVEVRRSWERLEGRDFLLEEVEFRSVRPRIEALPPPPGALNRQPAPGSVLHRVVDGRLLPPPRLVRQSTNTFQIARAQVDSAPGYVLDYVTLINSYTNLTLQGDTTYYVSGWVDVVGVLTIEGGSVIKFPDGSVSGGSISAQQIVCATGPYRPAIFTSKNDNTVGQSITNSTGSPEIIMANLLTGSGTNFNYLRFIYTEVALVIETNLSKVANCQFIDCGESIDLYWGEVQVDNVLFANSGGVSYIGSLPSGQTNVLRANHVTHVGSGSFAKYGSIGVLAVTNSILLSGVGAASVYHTNSIASSATFQTVGGGEYYLANGSALRNAGTTNINAALKADLQKKTTYPPVAITTNFTGNTTLSMLSIRDTDIPDLGYHYDALDYFIDPQGSWTIDPGVSRWVRSDWRWETILCLAALEVRPA
jgi:hypothetical protein